MVVGWLKIFALLSIYLWANLGIALSHVPVQAKVVHSHVHDSSHHESEESSSRERGGSHEHSHETLSFDCHSCGFEPPELLVKPISDRATASPLAQISPFLTQSHSELFRPPIG